MADLSAQRQRFADEFLIDLNATKAAIRAGYSEKTAHVQGPRLLENVDVKAYIDARRAERSQETQINAAWVLKRLAQEATADLADIYDENGAIKPIHDWPLIWRQGLVAGIKHTEVRDNEGNRTGEVIVDVKVSDRIRRLELIGKHIGVNAFQDIVEHKGLDSLADRLARAAKRSGE